MSDNIGELKSDLEKWTLEEAYFNAVKNGHIKRLKYLIKNHKYHEGLDSIVSDVLDDYYDDHMHKGGWVTRCLHSDITKSIKYLISRDLIWNSHTFR